MHVDQGIRRYGQRHDRFARLKNALVSLLGLVYGGKHAKPCRKKNSPRPKREMPPSNGG